VIQESVKVHNLLSLLHLPIRCIKGKKPLIDYSQPHVITSFQYLNIIRKKKMEKAIIKETKVGKKNEKEDRQTK
jgi:hypothetical protein